MAKKKSKKQNKKKEKASKNTEWEGAYGIFFSKDSTQKYGFLDDEQKEIEMNYLNKAEILQEVNEIGVLSEFSPLKEKLMAVETTHFLVAFDIWSKFGKNFVVCLAEPGISYVNQLFDMKYMLKEDELAFRVGKYNKEQEEIQATHQAWIEKTTYRDSVISLKKYVSRTMADTETEINSFEPKLSRARYRMTYKRLVPKESVHLTPVSAFNKGYIEWTHYIDPNFELAQRVFERSAQTNSSNLYFLKQSTFPTDAKSAMKMKPTKSLGSQTRGAYTRSKLVQTQFQKLSEKQKQDWFQNNSAALDHVLKASKFLEEEIRFLGNLQAY